MRRKKGKKFSASDLKTFSVPLKNPKRVRGERRQGAQKGSQEQGTMVKGQREKIQNGPTRDKKFGDEGGAVVQH